MRVAPPAVLATVLATPTPPLPPHRSPHLGVFSRLSESKRHFFALPNCYELFGLDFCVDANGKLWLLEANPSPSLGMFGADAPEGGIVAESPIDAVGAPPRFELAYSSGASRLFSSLRAPAAPAVGAFGQAPGAIIIDDIDE